MTASKKAFSYGSFSVMPRRRRSAVRPSLRNEPRASSIHSGALSNPKTEKPFLARCTICLPEPQPRSKILRAPVPFNRRTISGMDSCGSVKNSPCCLKISFQGFVSRDIDSSHLPKPVPGVKGSAIPAHYPANHSKNQFLTDCCPNIRGWIPRSSRGMTVEKFQRFLSFPRSMSPRRGGVGERETGFFAGVAFEQHTAETLVTKRCINSAYGTGN